MACICFSLYNTTAIGKRSMFSWTLLTLFLFIKPVPHNCHEPRHICHLVFSNQQQPGDPKTKRINSDSLQQLKPGKNISFRVIAINLSYNKETYQHADQAL